MQPSLLNWQKKLISIFILHVLNLRYKSTSKNSLHKRDKTITLEIYNIIQRSSVPLLKAFKDKSIFHFQWSLCFLHISIYVKGEKST